MCLATLITLRYCAVLRSSSKKKKSSTPLPIVLLRTERVTDILSNRQERVLSLLLKKRGFYEKFEHGDVAGGVKVGYELAGWCVLRRVWKYLLQEKRGFRRVA